MSDPAYVTALSPEGRAGLARCPKCARRRGIERVEEGRHRGLRCSTCGTTWDARPKDVAQMARKV